MSLMRTWLNKYFWIIYGGFFLLLLFLVRWEYFLYACDRSGDYALLALQVELAKDWQLFVGPYSRFGFNHPLPIYSYFYALWSSLWPSDWSWIGGMQLAVFLLNSACLLWTLYLLKLAKIGNFSLGVFSILAFWGIHFSHSGMLINIWGPATLLAPLVLFAVAQAVLVSGMGVGFSAAVLSTILLSSNHLVGVILASFGWLIYSFTVLTKIILQMHKEKEIPASIKRGFYALFAIFRSIGKWQLVVSLVSLMVAALPVVVDICINRRASNLYNFFRYSNSSEPRIGFGAAVEYFTQEMLLPVSNNIILQLIILIATIFVAFRLSDRFHRILLGLVCGGFAATLFFIANIRGPILPYLVWFFDSYLALLLYILVIGLFKAGKFSKTFKLGTLIVGAALTSFDIYDNFSRGKPSKCTTEIEELVTKSLSKNNYYQIVIHGQAWPSNVALLAYYMKVKNFDFCIDARYRLIFGPNLACAPADLKQVNAKIRLRRISRAQPTPADAILRVKDDIIWISSF